MEVLECLCSLGTSIREKAFQTLRRLVGVEAKEYEERINWLEEERECFIQEIYRINNITEDEKMFSTEKIKQIKDDCQVIIQAVANEEDKDKYWKEETE